MKNWCCDWFQNMIDSYGKKGFAIIAFNDSSCDFQSFYFTSIPFEQEIMRAFRDENLVWPIIRDEEGAQVPLAASLELRIPIDYCPKCGKKLAPLIRKKSKIFEELAKIHEGIEQSLY
jgi:hypothetical protein